jgi:hypothetical protein
MLTPQVNINRGLQLKGRETFSTFIFTANGVKMRNIFWLKGEAEAKSLHPLKCEQGMLECRQQNDDCLIFMAAQRQGEGNKFCPQ